MTGKYRKDEKSHNIATPPHSAKGTGRARRGNTEDTEDTEGTVTPGGRTEDTEGTAMPGGGVKSLWSSPCFAPSLDMKNFPTREGV